MTKSYSLLFICEKKKLSVTKAPLLLLFSLGRKQTQPQQYTHSQIQHAIYNLDRSKAKTQEQQVSNHSHPFNSLTPSSCSLSSMV
jgi:hypothetical protein